MAAANNTGLPSAETIQTLEGYNLVRTGQNGSTAITAIDTVKSYTRLNSYNWLTATFIFAKINYNHLVALNLSFNRIIRVVNDHPI